MIFSVPKSNYTDFYDIARFKMTWRINIIMAFVLPVLGLTFYFLDEIAAVYTAIGLVICIIMLIILKVSKSFTVPTIIFSVCGTIMCQWTLNFYTDSYHFVDTMWILIIVLFTYFSLGRAWGLASLVLNIIGLIYYIQFELVANLEAIKTLQNEDLIALSVNFIVSGAIISYLIMQFIQTSKVAENKFRNLTDELQEKNLEKTIMLKEIHHRVKNNLQVITSLLRLQSREIKDLASKTIYEESINRVIAMALIHEKMYQSKNLAKIDLEEYVNTLSQDLLRSYSVKEKVTIKVISDIETINTKHLVPLALIFNELISNSIKHAFTNIKNGEINISIINNKTHITLEYHDNGEWKSSNNSESFGMELIDSLTEQLSGSYKRTVNNGTIYNFTFAPIK
jgi:two-component sensor histidine kinase